MLHRGYLTIQIRMPRLIGRLRDEVVLAQHLLGLLDLARLDGAGRLVPAARDELGVAGLARFSPQLIGDGAAGATLGGKVLHGRHLFLRLAPHRLLLLLGLLARGGGWNSLAEDLVAHVFGPFARLQKRLGLQILRLVIADGGPALMRLDLAYLVLVGAGPERRHHLHARDGGDRDGGLRLAERRQRLRRIQLEVRLRCTNTLS